MKLFLSTHELDDPTITNDADCCVKLIHELINEFSEWFHDMLLHKGTFTQRTPVINKDLIIKMQSQFHRKGGATAAEGAAFPAVGGGY